LVRNHFNARWYDAQTARFISEDPVRDGGNWFAYVGSNPLKFVDPTGLISEEHEALLRQLSGSGLSKESLAGIRKNLVQEEINSINTMRTQLEALSTVTEFPESKESLIELEEELRYAESDLIRNIILPDFDQAPELATDLLNDRLADIALETVGDPYVWNGKPGGGKGGLDCSGHAQSCIEKAVGFAIPVMNANSLGTSDMTSDGDGSRGTLNFYDWPSSRNQDFDHVAVALGGGSIVNPSGGISNDNLENAGVIQLRGPFNTNPVNRQVNWREVLKLRVES
jgi:hypothetical protein